VSNPLRSIDDYEVGQKGVTATRTVTEADIVNFGGVTEDYNLPHMDRHAMAGSTYGARVAHGLLGSSLVTGMLSLRAPHVIGRGVPGAYLYSFDSNYRDGIRLGDTIRIQWNVTDRSNDSPYQDFGLVTTAFQVVNQDGVAIYDGSLGTLVRRASAEDASLQLTPQEPWQVTEFIAEPDKVYYVEDYLLGEGGDTDGRTITETDIVNFAALTGDYSPQFVDAEFARQGAFGSRVAHGLLIFSVTFGLWTSHGSAHRRGPPSKGAMVAGHLNDHASFVGAVEIGDTIRCRYKTLAIRASKSKPGIGLITTGLQAINQHDQVVMDGSTILMGVSRTGS
jgi:acyl dehydratase|tara:strand:- start:4749 stop:5756 length:1008 start_codon:yes stop_codon:yes gene_type:complete